MTAPPICSRRISRHAARRTPELAERENPTHSSTAGSFTYNAVYDLPWYSKSDNKFMRFALGGYILSGTYTFESPQFATVQSNIDKQSQRRQSGDRVLVNRADLRSRNGVVV